MDVFFYRPWGSATPDNYPPEWRMEIEPGIIKNLPDNQADLVIGLKYGDMQGQATAPRFWGVNSSEQLHVVLWNNLFTGFNAWDPEDLDAGVMTFASGEDLLRYTSGGKILKSPLKYPFPKEVERVEVSLSEEDAANMADRIAAILLKKFDVPTEEEIADAVRTRIIAPA